MLIEALATRGRNGTLLRELLKSLSPRAANVHFEDHLEQGRMTFDYRLRPGVVKRSNALELMRSVGLEV